MRAHKRLALNEDRSAIRCADLYERSTGSHSRAGARRGGHPSYFRALERERTIAAHDARTDPRTRDFLTGYLVPLDITSMLNAPIRVGGRMIGVVCHEHMGSPRGGPRTSRASPDRSRTRSRSPSKRARPGGPRRRCAKARSATAGSLRPPSKASG